MNKDQGPARFLSNHLKSREEHPRHKKGSDLSRLYLILPAMGVLLMLIGAFLPTVGVLPLFGAFLILIWSILNSRVSREKFSILRAEYIAAWMAEKKIEVDMKKVRRYTFFCLLPLYCMLTLPAILAVTIGEMMAWLMLGVPFTIICAVAMHAFSFSWRDLYIKRSRFWLMQITIFAAVNGIVVLIYFILTLI